ncbi:cupin domain-containing protein [Bacillus sp. FJAT-50079]|uniref:cupin domain-containing protein n=1 Tax=Bacillus sp. FJAT-50079 TaxID=2833577 RepID=UPI001BC9C831|nr:cupin domain-containing protein [Bacillus sp. FJAT-50079]MBS4210100.1 cupin domain-containing protein [Bacillus sp. FJAT-50079]
MNVKNASDVKRFNDGRLVRTQLFQEGKTTVFVLNFLPGQKLPPHPHPDSHVYLYIIEGKGVCTIDDQQYAIAEKDVIHAVDNQHVSVENTGDAPLSIYVVQAHESL